MRAAAVPLLAALLTILAALGLQLAMVAGVIRPSLVLALLGHAGLLAGLGLTVPAALRLARALPPPRQPPGDSRR